MNRRNEIFSAYKEAKEEFEQKTYQCLEIERVYLNELSNYLGIEIENFGILSKGNKEIQLKRGEASSQREILRQGLDYDGTAFAFIIFYIRINTNEFLCIAHRFEWDNNLLLIEQLDENYEVEISFSLGKYQGSFNEAIFQSVYEKILSFYKDEELVFDEDKSFRELY